MLTSNSAAIPINKWPFSCHNASGVNVPNQSTSVPINWNNTASITPVPTVSTVSKRIQPFIPSMLDQIKRNKPFLGVVGLPSG